MAPPGSGPLLTPPTVVTNNLQVYPDTYGRIRSPSESSHQSLHVPASPTTPSLDGETLASQRSRSSSFKSHAETFRSQAETARSRGNSVAGTFRSGYEGEHLTVEEALQPDKAEDPSFVVRENPFAFSPGQLNKLLNPKSLAAFKALGGLYGLEKGLRTDLKAGLSVDEAKLAGSVSFQDAMSTKTAEHQEPQSLARRVTGISQKQIEGRFIDRHRVYKDNRIPTKKPVTIWRLFWNAYNDRILMLLTVAAVISLTLGIYEAVSTQGVDWVEGVAIIVAIVIVVLVTGVNDYRRDRQFTRLNARKEDRVVKVIRSGKTMMLSVHDVTVGDILHLESGDSVPADGVLVSGHSIACDESSATGESDAMKKMGGHEVWNHIETGTATNKMDPFVISGSKVLEGIGTYIVTSVGVNSSHGKIMMSLQGEAEETPLQVKLGTLANWIGWIGTAAALILFFALLIRFVASLSTNPRTPAQKGSQFLDILIVAVTIIVVAVPEGLPLSVTLALSFATKRMYKENNLVRHLRACETMGNATTICSDKTGTLTQNKMTVVAGTLGKDVSFLKSFTIEHVTNHESIQSAFGKISSSFRSLLLQSAAINSTAFEGEADGQNTFIGSKTETALLAMAKEQLGMGPVAEARAAVEVAHFFPFDSNRKCMGIVIRLADGTYRFLVKGAAEIMLQKATEVASAESSGDVCREIMHPDTRKHLLKTIDTYASQSLRTIGFLYRDFDKLSPKMMNIEKAELQFEEIFADMTFLGLFGIEDPLREGVSHAVRQCQLAGIKVRMVTGDNVTTAKAIATECGIKTPDGIVIEGPAFRRLSDEDLDRMLPKLDVLARSSPEDKRILVTRLKHLGETVAVTGDGTNDAPALKAADIGFSMGIAGTEVAKEASSIILMDDNFRSIIKAIMWGRSVNDSVSKFLQFQITVNITAVILAFVSAVYSPEFTSVLSAVQLLWVNLIMDTFAALALATDAPTEDILDRPPVPKSAPLITTNMWKMIVGQSIYQLVVTFVLYFAGARILDYDVNAHPADRNLDQQIQLDTLVFNTFVWMQIFNEFNNRRLDNRLNIFEGMFRNYFFIGINIVMVAGQILIIFVGNVAFQIVPLDGTQWAISILCALPCLLWGVLLRCLPDKYAAVVISATSRAWHTVSDPVADACVRSLRPVFQRLGQIKSHAIRTVKRQPRPSATNDSEQGHAPNVESILSKPSTPMSPLSPPPITLTTMD